MNWFTNNLKQALNNATAQLSKSLSGEEELPENYGITPTLIEFVGSICQHPSTFISFPLDKDDPGTKYDRKYSYNYRRELNTLANKSCKTYSGSSRRSTEFAIQTLSFTPQRRKVLEGTLYNLLLLVVVTCKATDIIACSL